MQTHNFNIKVFARLSSKFRTCRLRSEFVQMDILPEKRDDLTNFTTPESHLLHQTDFHGVACVRRTHHLFSALSSVLQTSVILSATGVLVQFFNFSPHHLQLIFNFHDLISVFQTVGTFVIVCQRSN